MDKFYEQVISYLRLDEDDILIKPFIDAAKEYLTNAGVKFKEDSQLYILCTVLIVTHWYEERKVTPDIPQGARNIITQLKYSYEEQL